MLIFINLLFLPLKSITSMNYIYTNNLKILIFLLIKIKNLV